MKLKDFSLFSLLLLIVIILSDCSDAQAQLLQVTEVDLVSSDLSARTNSRLDINGNKCALVKFMGNAKVQSVSGNVIGDLLHKSDRETWCYLSPGTKKIIMNVENGIPCAIFFPDYDLSIEAARTYEVKFDFIDELNTVRFSELTMLFPEGISTLNSSQKSMLSNLAKTFNEFYVPEGGIIEIVSFVDNTVGSADYAQRLSGKLLSSIREYFKSAGVDIERIQMEMRGNLFFENKDENIVVVSLRKP